MRTILSYMMLLFSTVLFGQTNTSKVRLLETINFPASMDDAKEIQEVFFDEINQQTYRIYLKDLGAIPASEIKHTHEHAHVHGAIQQFESGLINESGELLTLSKNEMIRTWDNGEITTSLVDPLHFIHTLRAYELKNARLKETKRRYFNHAQITLEPLANGQLLLSDEWEGYGTQVQLFSKDWEELSTYYPQLGGFYYSKIGIHQKEALIAINPVLAEQKLKLARFDMSDGNLLSEVEIDRSFFNVKHLYPFEDGTYLLYGNSKENKRSLLKAKAEGTIEWEIFERLPYFIKGIDVVPVNQGNDGFMAITDHVEVLNFDTKGKTNWRKRLNTDYYATLDETNKHGAFRAAAMIVLENGTTVVLAGLMRNDGRHYNDYSYYESQVFIFNKTGVSIDQVAIEGNFKKMRLHATGTNKFSVLTDKKRLNYELY